MMEISWEFYRVVFFLSIKAVVIGEIIVDCGVPLKIG
jgi:hypothetical protein